MLWHEHGHSSVRKEGYKNGRDVPAPCSFSANDACMSAPTHTHTHTHKHTQTHTVRQTDTEWSAPATSSAQTASTMSSREDKKNKKKREQAERRRRLAHAAKTLPELPGQPELPGLSAAQQLHKGSKQQRQQRQQRLAHSQAMACCAGASFRPETWKPPNFQGSGCKHFAGPLPAGLPPQ